MLCSKHMVIRSVTELDDFDRPLYWSNTEGWVNMEYATVFNTEEVNLLNLPVSGEWCEID